MNGLFPGSRLLVSFVVLLGVRHLVAGADFTIDGMPLRVPDGFVIEKVAGPPLVNRPVHADFDDQGHLYVADSSGSNAKPDVQLKELPHRIVRLEDSDGDGVFDKSTVFADKMMFPEGCMYLDGSVYVGAPPSIWKLTDRDGDGVADVREEWFKGGTLTGCANDLHGPYAGLDGWIYWCKGAFAEQRHERVGKPPLVTRAAHIFRCRPDGSGLETVMTGGMDNPVEVAFLPNGERFFTTTFVHNPEAGKRDGVVHAIYGGVYGKVNSVVDGHPRTGDLMPVMQLWGAAAPAGLTRYDDRQLGADYQDNLFAALFNLHKVTRHELTPSGSTYASKTTDFVSSENPDFHPTDVLQDADGSLLVIDTGGWYKICCPTSQLAKPDVLGAIYRIRRANAPKVADPRGRSINWAKSDSRGLAALLADARPSVRKQARDRLVKRGADSVPALQALVGNLKSSPASARLEAVWALTRISAPAARKAVRQALKDPDVTVRHAAVQSIAVTLDKEAAPMVRGFLAGDSPAIARVAAEALGRLADAASVPALLDAAGGPQDRGLEHSLIFALIEIGDTNALAKAFQQYDHPWIRKAALLALAQLPGGKLEPATVVSLLRAEDPGLKQAAAWVISRHPEWGETVSLFLAGLLAKDPLTEPEQREAQALLLQQIRNEAVQKLIGTTAKSARRMAQSAALRAMAQSTLKDPPVAWLEAVAGNLKARDKELVRLSVLAARPLAGSRQSTNLLAMPLLKVGQDAWMPDEVRLDALGTVPGGVGTLDVELFNFLRAQFKPAQPVLTRGTAVAVLAKAKLSHDQLLVLAGDLGSAGPMEVGRLLTVFDGDATEEVGLKVVEALGVSPALTALRPEQIKPRLEKFPASVQSKGAVLIDRLNADASTQREQLDKLMSEMKGGDIRRGQALFNSPKAACATCHAMGYLGGRLGPDLTRVGEVRTERDLLEAIVFPSASFVRSYEPFIVTTKGGDDHTGVLLKDAPDEVVLATGPETEVRLARAEVAEIRPGTVSLMPQGLDQQLSRQELADLVTFLKNTHWGAQ